MKAEGESGGLAAPMCRARVVAESRPIRSQDRSDFTSFVQTKLAEPLEALSPMGSGGIALYAQSFGGQDLK